VAARELAVALHRHGIHLVYGGGTTGIMGELARTLVQLSGQDAVHGVIPEALLDYERSNTGIDRTKSAEYGHFTVVKDMHTRKAMMAEKVQQGGPGSGFLALSGGLGTIEELMETATWQQLGIHDRAVCILNTDGFWDGLVAWMKGTVVKAGFLAEEHWSSIGVKETAEDAINWLSEWKSTRTVNLAWGTKDQEVPV
jgi:uncharacterized protein (TIGR00730 family)